MSHHPLRESEAWFVTSSQHLYGEATLRTVEEHAREIAVDLGRRFRLIASEVDIVEPDAPLPALPVARAMWRPRPDLSTAAEAWLTAGGPHHTALTTALPVEPLEDYAEIAGIELVTIDAATTVPTFRKELRWNGAYYHLRGGI